MCDVSTQYQFSTHNFHKLFIVRCRRFFYVHTLLFQARQNLSSKTTREILWSSLCSFMLPIISCLPIFQSKFYWVNYFLRWKKPPNELLKQISTKDKRFSFIFFISNENVFESRENWKRRCLLLFKHLKMCLKKIRKFLMTSRKLSRVFVCFEEKKKFELRKL